MQYAFRSAAVIAADATQLVFLIAIIIAVAKRISVKKKQPIEYRKVSYRSVYGDLSYVNFIKRGNYTCLDAL